MFLEWVSAGFWWWSGRCTVYKAVTLTAPARLTAAPRHRCSAAQHSPFNLIKWLELYTSANIKMLHNSLRFTNTEASRSAFTAFTKYSYTLIVVSYVFMVCINHTAPHDEWKAAAGKGKLQQTASRSSHRQKAVGGGQRAAVIAAHHTCQQPRGPWWTIPGQRALSGCALCCSDTTTQPFLC